MLKSIRERMEYPRRIANMQEVESAREALRQARERLTEYAALMNSSAGSTGLTTHQVLWGDFTRATPERPPPEATLEFRFPDPLSINRFKLGELIGIGKALDDWAASTGTAAEPGHQPWRGVGNLNLNRFDRAKAIEVVAHWLEALEGLLAQAEQLSTTTGWDGLDVARDVAAATKVIAAIPSPEREVEEKILALAASDAGRHSLSRWADLYTRAHDLEAEIDAICSRQALDANPDAVLPLVEKVKAAGVVSLSVEELPKTYDQARQSAEQVARIVQLIAELLQLSGRDPGLGLDVKAEAMAAGYLYAVNKIPQENLRYRSAALTDENAVDDLSAAQSVAKEARSAAADARFSEPPSPSLAKTIPSRQELRQAAGALRATGFFGKLFGREWRRAKAICRRTFPEEPKLAPLEAARRLTAAALWKDRLQQLEACAEAKTVAGAHWNGADTPFDKLISVAEWMRSIQKVTPLGEQGARELRQLAYESGPDNFAMLARLAKMAESLNLVSAFQSAYAAKSTVHAEAQRQAERLATLQWVIERVSQLGIQPKQPIEALTKARAALLEARTLRQKMMQESVAVNACAAILASSELEKANTIQATLRYVEKVGAVRTPASVMRYLLQEGCATRLTTLKQMAEETITTLGQVSKAAEEADRLLKLRPEEWCGDQLDSAPIRTLLQKCQRAVQASDALEKQITLLSIELEAIDLGLGDLIRCWPAEGLRYAGVAQAVEAAFYRSAAEKLMRENPILARHAGNTHEQVRKRFQELDREILQLNRQMVAAELHARPIPPGRRAGSARDYTDNEMLAHQTGLQHPRIALRRLFSNAGSAIRAYTPCIMMSPMSVAQYLEPGKHNFDLLVIDEASQMRPEEALGAMLRCNQAVVVGDPEQLPPTDFFIPSDDSDDQQAEDAPEESILELAAPLLASDAHAGSSLPFAPPQPNSLFQPRVLRRALARLSKPRDGGPGVWRLLPENRWRLRGRAGPQS